MFSPKIYFLLFFSLFLLQCHFLKKSTPFELHFLNEQVFDSETSFKGFKLGGLSSLSFQKNSQTFFALSDDKKNHRIYVFALKKNSSAYRLELKDHILLKTAQKPSLPFRMDPEALDIGKDKSFYIASEGQQKKYKKPEPTQIFQFDSKGTLKEAWPVPPVFWDETRVSEFGVQENKGFESLSLTPDFSTLWVATENPLLQDLKNQKKDWVRLSEFKISSKKLIAQYAYPLQHFTGLTETIFLKNKNFLTLERAYNEKKKSEFIFLFWTDCQKASNLLKKKEFKNFEDCSKKLLWSSKKEKNIKAENLEGMTLGPRIDSQRQLLVFVSDNNFKPGDKTQILFFELKKTLK